MISKYFECEADKSVDYYRVIQTKKAYRDGRYFPLNEVVIADQKVDLNATDRTKLGGFCISTYDYVFRWLIRGDTLCKVIIPDDTKIYKTASENGIYVADKMILTEPVLIDDDVALKLYNASCLPEISYFKALTACSICGYINTALKVLEDKVNKSNVDTAISEFEDFCKRRKEEKYVDSPENIEAVKLIHDKLYSIIYFMYNNFLLFGETKYE